MWRGGRGGWTRLGLVKDVRETLLAQESFHDVLAGHEREAVQRHRSGGASAYQRRRLVRVNLTPFGLAGYHNIFAVRMTPPSV